jgi:peptide deformylase
MKEIVQDGNPTLRKKALPIPVKDITSKKVQKLLAEMKESLHSQEDGLAIAAPQIGESYRIFVVAGSLFATKSNPEPNDEVYINPEIIKTSAKKVWRDGEGCLSVRWQYGKVKRYTNVTIKAFDEEGNEFTESAGGLRGHIFQHEIDHLDGILFIDKAENLRTEHPEHFHE